MIRQMFVLQDVKGGTFGNPVFVPSLGTLVRDITDVVNDRKADQLLSKHPADFRLFRLGEFDDTSGRFVLSEHPEFILDCSSLILVGSEATAAS